MSTHKCRNQKDVCKTLHFQSSVYSVSHVCHFVSIKFKQSKSNMLEYLMTLYILLKKVTNILFVNVGKEDKNVVFTKKHHLHHTKEQTPCKNNHTPRGSFTRTKANVKRTFSLMFKIVFYDLFQLFFDLFRFRVRFPSA